MSKHQHTPYGLRIPPDLKEQIKQAAAHDGRSMNAQIVHHLRTIYQPTELEDATRTATV